MSEKDTNKVNVRTFVRSFYSHEFSTMKLSYSNTNLSLRFYQYEGKEDVGLPHYDLPNGIAATVNYEGASYLYMLAMSILEGRISENVMKAVLRCNKATLIFEYYYDEGEESVYLDIEKNGQKITFKFKTRQVELYENGQKTTRVIHSGLCAFAKTLEGYLTGIGADIHLSKLPDNFGTDCGKHK